MINIEDAKPGMRFRVSENFRDSRFYVPRVHEKFAGTVVTACFISVSARGMTVEEAGGSIVWYEDMLDYYMEEDEDFDMDCDLSLLF